MDSVKPSNNSDKVQQRSVAGLKKVHLCQQPRAANTYDECGYEAIM